MLKMIPNAQKRFTILQNAPKCSKSVPKSIKMVKNGQKLSKSVQNKNFIKIKMLSKFKCHQNLNVIKLKCHQNKTKISSKSISKTRDWLLFLWLVLELNMV